MQPPKGPKADGSPVESAFNIRHQLHVLMERRWLAISAFIVVMVLTAIYLARATPIYQATARIQIDREGDNALNLREGGPASDPRYEMDYLQTQYKNLQSRTLIEAVARKLKLETDPRYSKSVDIINAIVKDITIAPVRMSRLVDIRVEHSSKNQAQLIANTLADTFIQNNKFQKQQASFDALLFLQTQVADTKRDVQRSQDAMQAYRSKNNTISLDDQNDIVRQELLHAQNELNRVRIERLQAEKGVSEIQALVKAGRDLESVPGIADNPVIMRLRQELVLKEGTLAAFLERYREKHPTILQARGEVKKIRDELQKEAASYFETLRNKADLLRKNEDVLQANVDAGTKKMQALNQLRISYDVLKSEAETAKLMHNNVLARMNETQVTSKLAPNNIHMIDPAPLPTNPVKPRVALILALGLFGGLATALGLAFFVSYLDDSVKSQDDVETTLGLPFLGYVPNIKTNSVVERDLQAHSHPQSNAAEGFRTIRATLSLTHKSDKLRTLSISSTIPSEGKSLVASNLAIVSAQTGLRTVLVDADLRRPSVHKAYQLHSPVGLSAFLTGETSKIEDVIHHTEVPNLDVICCGAVPSNPSELIGSKRMKEFIEQLREKYDRVVLDCPPISAVSDPLVLAAQSDGIIFVAKFNKIRREHARRSVQRIQNAGIHVMGVVINDIDFEGKDSYYYSYYYYQNRYYASHYKTGKDGGKDKKAKDAAGIKPGQDPKAKKPETVES